MTIKIIYPKPIRKARRFRVIEVRDRLAPTFILFAALMAFFMAMQSIPYVINLMGGGQ